MSMFLKFIAHGDERLDVSSASYYLDDNIKLDSVCWGIIVFWRRCWRPVILELGDGNEFGECFAESGVEVNVDPSVFCMLCDLDPHYGH